MNSKRKILIVEDEKDIADLIHFNIFKAGFDASLAMNGNEAIEKAKTFLPDLILLDLMIPEISGYEVCTILKENPTTKQIPIIILTARGTEEDIVKGLESGADDYLTKPFSPKVLIARVNAVFRRVPREGQKENDLLRIGSVRIDQTKRKVFLKETELELTFSEFEILLLLLRKPGWVFTRAQIVNLIRGTNHAITDRSVDVQIVGLRKKLGDFGGLIETVRGVGYRFKESE
jgi:two-component system, OmpR family, alkaline phosphatase synthesis response regulator PhoP